jgi:hypothetical protein
MVRKKSRPFKHCLPGVAGKPGTAGIAAVRIRGNGIADRSVRIAAGLHRVEKFLTGLFPNSLLEWPCLAGMADGLPVPDGGGIPTDLSVC